MAKSADTPIRDQRYKELCEELGNCKLNLKKKEEENITLSTECTDLREKNEVLEKYQKDDKSLIEHISSLKNEIGDSNIELDDILDLVSKQHKEIKTMRYNMFHLLRKIKELEDKVNNDKKLYVRVLNPINNTCDQDIRFSTQCTEDI